MRIKIGDDFLDMDNSVIAQTYAVNEIGAIETRQGGFSNNFTIPLTAKNQGILGTPGNINSNSRNPYTKVSATLYDNGVPISDGYLRFQVVDDRTLQASFFGDNSNWYNLIKDKKLTDLDLSAYDHDWTDDVIGAAINADKSSGYTYPLIDYGDLGAVTDFEVEATDLYPAIFCSTLLDQIFFEIGWKASGDLIDHPLFKRMIIPFSGKAFAHSTDFIDTHSFTEAKDISQAIPATLTLLTWDNIDTGVAVTATGTYTVTVLIVVTGSIVGSDSIQFRINGVTNQTLTGITAAGSYRWIVTVDMETGDEISTAYVIAGGSTPTVTTDSSLQIELTAPITLGGEIQMSAIMPDIKQSDFIKYFSFAFGLIPQANTMSKTVTFSLFKNIKANLPDALDWSNKIDVGSTREVDFTQLLDNYKSVSIIKYKEDSDDPELSAYEAETGKGFGQGEIDIDNEHISGEATIYEAPFTPMININSFNNQIYIPQITYKESGEPTIKPKPKIAILSENFQITDLTLGLFDVLRILGDPDGYVGNFTDVLVLPFCWFAKTSYTTEVDALLDSLAFDQIAFPNAIGDPLKDRFLDDYIDILNSMKYLKAYFHLTEIDINNLDFTVPVYIEKYKSYFYISKINNYQGSRKVTECELVKIG